jgi:lambda repressor-like predicted transcriptional regulator
MIQWDFPVDEPVSVLNYRRPGLDNSIEEIAELARGGMSIRALAGKYGVSREAIRRALCRAAVAVSVNETSQSAMPLRRVRVHRLPGRGRSRAFTPEEVVALHARREAGESMRSLARAAGVSHETVRRVLATIPQRAGESATA